MGRDPAGERTLAAFDGMNKSTWQPATNAIGCKVVVQEDAPEQVAPSLPHRPLCDSFVL